MIPMKPSVRHAWLALGALASWSLAARLDAQSAADGAARPGSYVKRLEASLLLQTLNADLLSHDSATATLERWCTVHELASPARMTAEIVRGVAKPATEDQRQRLRLAPADEVHYRRVRLLCGTVALSAPHDLIGGALAAPARGVGDEACLRVRRCTRSLLTA